MSRDYQKKRNVRQGRSASGQFLWILASFLGGYLVANVFDFTSLSNWVNKHVLASHNPQPAPQVVKKTQAPKPKFEFYTLLAKDSSTPVPVSRAAAAPPPPAVLAAPAPKVLPPAAITTVQQGKDQPAPAPVAVAVKESKPPATPAARKESWLVQIASFNKRQDAEHLKASLIMRGYDVGVTPVPRQGITWYRVTIGPFPSRVQAEKAQVVVAKTERIKGMVKRNETTAHA